METQDKSRVIASGIISLQDTDIFGDSKGKKGDYEYNLSQHERNGQSAMWNTWAIGCIKNFPRMQKKCVVSFISNTKESI